MRPFSGHSAFHHKIKLPDDCRYCGGSFEDFVYPLGTPVNEKQARIFCGVCGFIVGHVSYPNMFKEIENLPEKVIFT